MMAPNPKPLKCDACGFESMALWATVEWIGGVGYRRLYWCEDRQACLARQEKTA